MKDECKHPDIRNVNRAERRKYDKPVYAACTVCGAAFTKPDGIPMEAFQQAMRNLMKKAKESDVCIEVQKPKEEMKDAEKDGGGVTP